MSLSCASTSACAACRRKTKYAYARPPIATQRAHLAKSTAAVHTPSGSGKRTMSRVSPAIAPDAIATTTMPCLRAGLLTGSRPARATAAKMLPPTMSWSTRCSSQPRRISESGQFAYMSNWNSSCVESAKTMASARSPPRQSEDHGTQLGAAKVLISLPGSHWVDAALVESGRRKLAVACEPILRPNAVESSSVERKWMPPHTRASSISFSICVKLV